MAWRGAVGGTGAVEVGQDVLAAADQGSGQGLDLLQPVGDGLPQGVDELLHQVLSQTRLLGAVGLDEALVDAPGGLDRSVAIISEEVLQALGLGVGEQIGWDVMPGQETVTYGWPIRDGYVARLRFQNDVLVDVNLDTGITLVAMDPALSNVRLDPTLVGYRIVK